MEETNVRHLESLPEPIDLIVGDLSFISPKLYSPQSQHSCVPEVRQYCSLNLNLRSVEMPWKEEASCAPSANGAKRSNGSYKTQEIKGSPSSMAQTVPYRVPRQANVEYFAHLQWTRRLNCLDFPHFARRSCYGSQTVEARPYDVPFVFFSNDFRHCFERSVVTLTVTHLDVHFVYWTKMAMVCPEAVRVVAQR